MLYEYKQYYRRNLPHIHSPGATLFITFRLAGSIPKSVLRFWNAERQLMESQLQAIVEAADRDTRLLDFRRRWFAKFEKILDKPVAGPLWLKDSTIAGIVAESLKNLDGTKYKLHAFCIMSNHVHVLLTPFLNERTLKETQKSGRVIFESTVPTMAAIMQSIKGFTARESNKVLGQKGQFWQRESYDHEVRNGEEFSRILKYILNNPVKAGLVREWRQWPWSWWEKM